MRPADRVRQVVIVVFAVGQIAASFLPTLTGYGRPLGEGDATATETATNPVAPPGPAFAIWGLLFPAVLLYAGYQAAPSRRADPLLRRVGWPMAGGLALCSVWVSLSQLVGITAAADTGFSAAVLACYLFALSRLASRPGAGTPPRLVSVPVALVAGWLTVAFGVNLAAALVAAGGGLSPGAVALSVVVAAGVAGVLVPLLVGGGGWYAGPVAWGLGWVAAGNAGSDGDRVVAVAAGAAAVLVAAAAFLRPARPERNARLASAATAPG